MIKSHSLEVILTPALRQRPLRQRRVLDEPGDREPDGEEYDRAPTLWQTNNNGRPWRVTAVGVYELPFGPGRPFLSEAASLAAIASGWSVGGTYRVPAGRTAQRGTNTSSSTATWTTSRRTSPRSRFSPTGRSTRRRPGSTSTPGSSGRRPISRPASRSGCSRSASTACAASDLSFVNANVARTFDLGGRRTFQFRLDIQNLLNRQHYGNPDMNPTSTNFGQVRAVNNNVMRFITFNTTFASNIRGGAGFLGTRQPALGCRHEALTVAESGNNLGTIRPNTGQNGGVGPTRKQDESTR